LTATQEGGLWHFLGRTWATPLGVPTRLPWQDIEFLTDCVMVFDAETGVLKTQEGRVITATPPSGATP
jgi:hypothetical protein